MSTATPVGRKGMVVIPAGSFVMGSDAFYPEERPAHARAVQPLLLDEHPVTNLEFRRFVRETGHVTVAEQLPAADDFPDADELVPGSLVFRRTSGPVPLDNWQRWWHWVPGASWQFPEGPESSLAGRDRHPVVHVAYEDARAYAQWAGKRLPTEPEWEYACRAGSLPSTYAWGEDPKPRGRAMANTWEGRFPYESLGQGTTTPVGRYRSNDWGLADMIGNVWEWTSSPWTADHAGIEPAAAVHSCCGGGLREEDRRVMKGGSHLCADSYCLRYRPPARQGQTVNSSTSHLGFRCAADPS